MKPVFFTAAYQSRDPQAAWELKGLENFLCLQAREMRDCETGTIDLSAPGWESKIECLLQAGRLVWIQPVLLFDGLGQKKLEAFSRAVVGRPLVEGEEDFAPLVSALGLSAGQKTLLLAHGGETAAPVLRKLSAWLENRGEPVFAAALKGKPGWEETLDWAKRRCGSGEIELIPLLLTAGVHFRRDAAREWRERLEAAGFAVRLRGDGLAGLAGIRELYRERVRELMEAP